MSSLEQFLIFRDVAESGNITQASNRLHISQPSVSVQIQHLEQEFGAQLFDRTNRGVTLTNSGKILYEKVVFVLDELDQTKDAIENYSARQNSHIHIGVTLNIGDYILPHVLGLAYPGQITPQFSTQIADTASIERMVDEHKLDIGLVEGTALDNHKLTIEKFWNDELMILVAPTHPWAELTSVEYADLAAERLIVREKGSIPRELMDSILTANGFDPSELNIAMELNSTQAIKEAVVAGLGVALLSALATHEMVEDHRLSALRLTGRRLLKPLSIITRKDAELTAEEEWFLSQIRSYVSIKTLIPSLKSASK